MRHIPKYLSMINLVSYHSIVYMESYQHILMELYLKRKQHFVGYNPKKKV
jgi:hypothetical protein